MLITRCMEICDEIGLDGGLVADIRSGHWLSFSCGAVWVRCGTADMVAVAEREVDAAAALGPLAAAPRSDVLRTRDGGCAVIWERLQSVRAPAWADVAALAARAREATHSRPFDVAATAVEWIGRGVFHRVVSAAEAAALTEMALCAESALASAAVGAIHGDAHLGNLVITCEGARYVDLETSCQGPIVYDLAPMEVERRRFGADPQQVCDALELWQATTGDSAVALPDAAALYEVWAASWCVNHATTHHASFMEARLRVRSLTLGEMSRWTRQ